jgi:hypothetical protein
MVAGSLLTSFCHDGHGIVARGFLSACTAAASPVGPQRWSMLFPPSVSAMLMRVSSWWADEVFQISTP